MTYSAPHFSRNKSRDFDKTLKRNVNQYFKENNIRKSANGFMIFKTIFHLTFWIGTYVALMFGGFSLPVQYILWPLLGFAITQVTVNIGHDAIHGAYSNKKWVNDLLSHTFNFNGASAYMWHRMHNIAHHTYTNVDGFDGDIEPFPLIRISPYAKYLKIHKYQKYYAYFFYCFATLSWVFGKDYVKFFQNKVGNFDGKDHPKREYFLLFLYKAIYYTLFIVVPFVFIEQPWYHILAGFFLMHFVSGFFLASVFMLAHAMEPVEFDKPTEEGDLRETFLAHQLRTTANFSTKNPLAAFITGGLNTQIEHHLFPNICSCHYPAISDIVKATAKEFNEPYYDLNFSDAMASHNRFLADMGDPKFALAEEK